MTSMLAPGDNLRERYLRTGLSLAFCVWGFLRCINYSGAEGGAINGRISLLPSFYTPGQKVVVLLSGQSNFMTFNLQQEYYPVGYTIFYSLQGVKNGTYYIMVFQDANNDGVFNANLPSGDANLSEYYAIYGPLTGNDYNTPNPYPVSILNNTVDNADMLLAQYL